MRRAILTVLAVFAVGGATPAVATTYNPVLSVEGQTLHWTATAPQGHYIVEGKPPNAAVYTVKVDQQTSYTPVPDLGFTVGFRVRPGRCKCWSNEVTIKYGESQAEKEARELKEREEREQSEREQKEREQKEREEREQKEREEKEKEAPKGAAGEVKYRLNAKSAYDPYAGNTTFLTAHIDRVLCYVTFCDSHYLPYLPVVAYHDAYTKCGAGGLNLTCRATYVKEVERDVKAGYVGANGQFMDDVEWSGSGQHIAGTDEEMASLIEAVRKAMPNGILELNTQYSDLKSRLHNPYVERALAVTNHIDKEFGVNANSGINSPTAFTEYLTYVDALHSKGIHIDQADSTPGNTYELGTYLLNNDGGDYIGSAITPETWSTLYDTNLGAATSPRESVSGIYRRHFEKGTVYVDPPGGPTVTVDGHSLSSRQGLIV